MMLKVAIFCMTILVIKTSSGLISWQRQVMVETQHMPWLDFWPRPSLKVKCGGSKKYLPHGDLLLIGGDLAYPNPSAFTYERRLFCPFEYALQPPSSYKAEQIAINKPELPYGVTELKKYKGPQSFVIPGNHDWFDGLHTFMRYICHKSWLGGWFLPQKKSYFALQLPRGWWVFGLD
ncbi:uncharacterized protein A4U43_C03F28680 [Asparagus officinalis]|uniref:Uncharacterized protein n=1 Tax=Asparagus officinalis TaxID=4686 RepID=A0A5P1FDM7_ASPOF|nr:uncharacterized protein A4U43_C03F28680 [Asparagus officinalis]